MSNLEFAKYTSDLNAAASAASRKLRDAHGEEYSKYLHAEMNARGYEPNPGPTDRPRWRRKESWYGTESPTSNDSD